jgi:uncharacterized lipoprotein YmbA
VNTNWLSAMVVCCVPWLVGCRSVEVPSERFFRLDPPAMAVGEQPGAGILRVYDLQLGRAIDGDRLMVADGVRLEPRPLDRWVAPLDRLVTDALVLGLSRSGACALVKGAVDPGDETWSLHGRIVEFAEVRGTAGPEAHVALELWLEADGQLLFQGEFAAAEPLREPGPDAAVAALSRGVHGIVFRVVQRMQHDSLFTAARPVASPAR